MAHWLDKVILLLQADTADLRELARLAGADPRIFYRGIDPGNLDLTGQDVTGMEFAAPPENNEQPEMSEAEGYVIRISNDDGLLVGALGAVRTIHRLKHQEARLAVLLNLILLNRSIASYLLDLYSNDRAKYTNQALQQLRNAFQTQDLKDQLNISPAREIDDETLAKIVYRPFSRGMPMNRALMLCYMAKYLAHSPPINKFLRIKMDKSSSIFLDPYRQRIKQYLDESRDDLDWLADQASALVSRTAYISPNLYPLIKPA